jgi:hypothetical protein
MERRASPSGHSKFVIEENPVILSEGEGTLHFACAQRMHSSFASLRMTIFV